MISSKDEINKKKKYFYENVLYKIKEKQISSNTIFNSTDNVFVTFGDNNLKVGPVFSSFDASKSYGLNYKDIVEKLALGINTYNFTTVKPNYRDIDKLQEISLTKKPIDLEVSLEKKLNFNFDIDKITNPIGFKGKLKSIDILENPKIPWQVSQVLDEKLKAVEEIKILQDYGFDNYYLTKIMSTANLGLDKRLVTTRQSITAIDDILTKSLLDKIKDYESINGYYLFENSFLHNKFYIILLEGNWEYEAFEIWPKGSEWNTTDYNYEYENFNGRTSYAKLQGGGYYAARLGVAEYLEKIKKQARVLVIREIDSEYFIPVGVWQVRENVRNAFLKYTLFNSKQEIQNYLQNKIKNKTILKESKMFKQSRLNDFF